MTLSEGRRRVWMLLDEYSVGGALTADEDIAYKMNDFFDTAQKDMAAWQPILRTVSLDLDGSGAQALPEDVGRVLRLTRNGRRARGCRVLDRTLYYPAGETEALTLDYEAVPATIGPDTADGYVFEVSEAAAACLPFFVAAQQLLPDLVVDYGAFYSLYLQMRGALPRDAGGYSGFGGLTQALYGGGS